MISSENQRFGWFVKFATVQFREEMLNLLNEVLTVKNGLHTKKDDTDHSAGNGRLVKRH